MKEINIEYQNTIEEIVRGSLEVTRSVVKHGRALPFFGVMWIICGIAAMWLTGETLNGGILFCLIMGILLTSIPLISRWQARQNARKIPGLDKPVKWQITEAELKTSTEDADTRFAWNQIIKVHERKLGFLLFPQPRLAHWIPKHAFQNEADIELLREIVKSKGIDYKR